MEAQKILHVGASERSDPGPPCPNASDWRIRSWQMEESFPVA